MPNKTLTLHENVIKLLKDPLKEFLETSAILEAFYKRSPSIKAKYTSYMLYQKECVDYHLQTIDNTPDGYNSVVLQMRGEEVTVEELTRRIVLELYSVGLYFFLNLSVQQL